MESSALAANSGSHPGGSVNAATNPVRTHFMAMCLIPAQYCYGRRSREIYASASGKFPKRTPDNLKRNQFGGVIGGPI